MALFEVFIPARESGLPNVTLKVEGRNWIEALRSGLKSIGEGQESIANVMCDIKEDSSIHVTDVSTRRVFRLREIVAQVPEPTTIPEGGPRPVSIPDAEDTIKMPAGGPGAPGGGFSSSPKTLIEFPVPKFAPQAAPVPATTPSPAPVPPPARTMQSMPAAAPPPAADPAPTISPAAAMPPPAMAPAREPTPGVGSPNVPAPVTAAAMPFTQPPPMAAPPRPSDAADTMKIDVAELQQTRPMKSPSQKDGEPVAARPASGPVPGPGTPSRPISPPTPRGVPAPAPKRPSGQFQNAPAPQWREESKPLPTDPKIGRADAPKVDVQDAIAAVFDATQDLYMAADRSASVIAEKLLDIALTHIPADAGTFYLADVNAYELTFAAVRGPKADALKRSGMTVPLGQGIIGFVAQEGICLSVSDIQKDPRWLASIAQAIDYKPRDTLCASSEKDGRLFGAIQLINSKGGFDAAHMEVLRFIGLTAAALLEQATAGD